MNDEATDSVLAASVIFIVWYSSAKFYKKYHLNKCPKIINYRQSYLKTIS